MASRDQDEAMAGLLRQSLSRGAPAGNDCPEPEILAAYYERALGQNELGRYELHFSQCGRCREQLAVMARSEEKPQPAPKSAWTWDWRWLAATAAVLIVVSALGLARNAKRAARFASGDESPKASSTSPASEAPLLALSEPDQSPAARPALPATHSLAAPQPSAAPARNAAPAAGKELAQNSPADSKAKKTAPASPFSGRSETGSQELDKAIGGNISPQATDTTQRRVSAATQASQAAAGPPAQPASAPAPLTANDAIVAEKKELPTPEARAEKAPAAEPLNALKRAYQSVSVQRADQLSDQTLIRTPDPKIFWRITGGSFAERTTDGGATWQGQLPDSNAQLTTGSAPSGKVCWMVGKSGIILLTRDAVNWKKISPPVPADFMTITAKNASSATITTADGQKFATTDGGRKWKPAP